MRTAMNGRSLSLLITVFLFAWPGAAQTACAPQEAAGKRLAFVIGNSDYGSGDLVSGKEDAMAVADALTRWLGFEVTSFYDRPKKEITDAWEVFKNAIGEASVVVFFYSGHGYELLGNRYLQPVNGSAAVDSAIPLQTILQGLPLAPNKAAKLAFMDACGTQAQLPAGASPGVGRGDAIPTGVLVSYAANPGQIAASGSNGSLSPYTKAVVRHIQEPGLTVTDFLKDVHDEVLGGSASGQAPDSTEPIVPNFCLRSAVTVEAQVSQVDDGLVAVLRDQIAIDHSHDAPSEPITLTLNAGDNPLAIMVYNQKSFHNTQSWERTEGWSYSLSLRANGQELTAAGCQAPVCFRSAGEDVPFKDGPHHGKVFKVAAGNLHVDPVSAALVLQGVDTETWKQDKPIYSQQQEPLYDEQVKNLPLGAIQAFGGTIDALTLIQELAAAAQLVGFSQIPDFNALHVAVWGNHAFRAFVQVCMVDKQADRISDLNTSIGSIFTSETPFKSFDEKLSQCVFGEAAKQPGNAFTAGDVKVWTALEDPSH